jgi:hypothetical protein
MKRKYAARWTTDEDRRGRHTSANGIVEDVTFKPPEFVCFASPLALAQRIAYGLNLASRFELPELEAISTALTATKG